MKRQRVNCCRKRGWATVEESLRGVEQSDGERQGLGGGGTEGGVHRSVSPGTYQTKKERRMLFCFCVFMEGRHPTPMVGMRERRRGQRRAGCLFPWLCTPLEGRSHASACVREKGGMQDDMSVSVPGRTANA